MRLVKIVEAALPLRLVVVTLGEIDKHSGVAMSQDLSQIVDIVDPSSAVPFSPRAVQRPREQVESQIQHAILSGLLSNGARLPSETLLAEQFGVSRPTVREALSTLKEKGLITKASGSNGGSFVRYVDHHALDRAFAEQLSTTLEVGSVSGAELIAFRNMIEVPSAREAALNRSDAHLEKLRSIIEREKAISVFDAEAPDLNSEFHQLLAEASGNRILEAVVSAVHRLTHPMDLIEWTPEVGREGVRHHINIVRALTKADPDEAETAMRAHLHFLQENSREIPTHYRELLGLPA
jgi:GntR family transcriptional repressor for pyruvate dehydrogenase complex